MKKTLKKYKYALAIYGAILLLGIILILLAPNLPEYGYNVLLGIGCSIIPTAIVSLILLYFFPDEPDETKIFGLSKIWKRRSEIRLFETEKFNNNLDFICFGLSHFRSSYDAKKQIVNAINKGLDVRILTVVPNSKYTSEQAIWEGNSSTNIKKDIEELIQWVEEIKNETKSFNGNKKGSIAIKFYHSLPLLSFCRTDNSVFVGSYTPGKPSSEVLTYQYKVNSDAGQYYIQLFNNIWENKTPVKTSTTWDKFISVNQTDAIQSIMGYFCDILQRKHDKELWGRKAANVISVVAIFKGELRRTFYSHNRIGKEKHLSHKKHLGTVGRLEELNVSTNYNNEIRISILNDYVNNFIFICTDDGRNCSIEIQRSDVQRLTHRYDAKMILAAPLFSDIKLDNGTNFLGSLTFDFAEYPPDYNKVIEILQQEENGGIGIATDQVYKILIDYFKNASDCAKLIEKMMGQDVYTKFSELYEEEWRDDDADKQIL